MEVRPMHGSSGGTNGRLVFSFGFGMWRSLVAHLIWDQGVAGSNPVIPTGECPDANARKIQSHLGTPTRMGLAANVRWVTSLVGSPL